jgi:hypothetical protein
LLLIQGRLQFVSNFHECHGCIISAPRVAQKFPQAMGRNLACEFAAGTPQATGGQV